MSKTILILHNNVLDETCLDEQDNLVERDAIVSALNDLGYISIVLAFTPNFSVLKTAIEKINPDLVFNIVESVDGKGEFIYLAPAFLDMLKIKYTGCLTNAMFVTSNKILAKQILRMKGIATPNWNDLLEKDKKVICKAIWEHASINLDENSIFVYDNVIQMQKLLDDKYKKDGLKYFFEEYIDGREFNVTMLGDKNNPFVMTPAEIVFDYIDDKPNILSYKAKWEPESVEYKNSVVTLKHDKKDEKLLEELKNISRKVWDIFELNGYARVDFRVDTNNRPFVLEVNANPCISPDSGFVRACLNEDISYNEMIERILKS